MMGLDAGFERVYSINGRSFTYKGKHLRSGLLCESEETKVMHARLANVDNLPEFLMLFADLLENYEGVRVMRPTRYSEVTGEPVEWGFVDPKRPYDVVVVGRGSFRTTYSVSPSIQMALIDIAKGAPRVFVANGGTYIVYGVSDMDEDHCMRMQGVRISKAVVL